MHDPDMDYDDDDDDDDNLEVDECQIHLNDDMNVMDAELNNDPFVNLTSTMNNSNVNHYMNVSSTINPNVNSTTNDYYQNVMQLQQQNGDSV